MSQRRGEIVAYLVQSDGLSRLPVWDRRAGRACMPGESERPNVQAVAGHEYRDVALIARRPEAVATQGQISRRFLALVEPRRWVRVDPQMLKEFADVNHLGHEPPAGGLHR